jgi:hypothetical protein
MTTNTIPRTELRSTSPAAAPTGAGVNGKVAGAVLLTGFVITLAGSGLQTVSGDFPLFSAMETSSATEIGDHLVAIAGARGQLVTSLVLWIIGIPMMAAGFALVSRLGSNSTWATVSRWALAAGAGACIVFFSMMIGIVVGLAPAHVAGENVIAITRALGAAADTADQFTTILILSIGGVAAVLAGRGDWVPGWLTKYSVFAAVAGLVSLLTVAFGAYELTDLPLVFMLAHPVATAIVAMRRLP